MHIKGITKGDSIFFQFEVSEDITGWKIRAELYDECNSIKLANTASGGSDSQIITNDASDGVFTVIVPKDRTTAFDRDAHLEVEIEDSDSEKFTILNGKDTTIEIKCERIDWTTP